MLLTPSNLLNASLNKIAASSRGPYTTAEGEGSAVERRTSCRRLAGHSVIEPKGDVDQSTSLVLFRKSSVGVFRVQSNFQIELDLFLVTLTIAAAIVGSNGWWKKLSTISRPGHGV